MVGRLSHGPDSTLVERTLQFVRSELPRWRDDPGRPQEQAEEALNSDLCKHLTNRSRQLFPMVFFHHEERQTRGRRVDMSALPSDGAFVGDTYYSFRDPFIVFEGKRLPAPSSDREREYVTGGERLSGGIQRFKLGLHGAGHRLVGMIGYVQADELGEWFKRINGWILDLVGDDVRTSEPCPLYLIDVEPQIGEVWQDNEQLTEFVEDAVQRSAQSTSTHPRTGRAVSSQICIRHLWVRMS